MRIVVINGTPYRGVTHHIKESFLRTLREGNEIAEFYPADLPGFCVGCKNCFLRGEEKCPHVQKTEVVWQAFRAADLLVFAYPVYAMRAPASIKSLLDHLCVHWMVHRPDPVVFTKTAVILTNSVGAPNGAAQKDVKTSLTWMGVSKIHIYGIGMMGDIDVTKMSPRHKSVIKKRTERLAARVVDCQPRTRRSLKVGGLFAFCKWQHQMGLKSETRPSLDNAHYLNHGWIKPV
jgi:multimeric flavodoxin WrbA